MAFFFFFSLISLIVDGPHHHHPACGHKGSSHLSPVHALHFFIAMQVQHSYNSSTNGCILLTHVPTLSATKEKTQILLWRESNSRLPHYQVSRLPTRPLGRRGSTFHIRQHIIQKNANRVSCAAYLELVQVQAHTITSQERNVSLSWMPGGHVALASAV